MDPEVWIFSDHTHFISIQFAHSPHPHPGSPFRGECRVSFTGGGEVFFPPSPKWSIFLCIVAFLGLYDRSKDIAVYSTYKFSIQLFQPKTFGKVVSN